MKYQQENQKYKKPETTQTPSSGAGDKSNFKRPDADKRKGMYVEDAKENDQNSHPSGTGKKSW